jgi:molecular chaperone GrpE (heat shock protein)
MATEAETEAARKLEEGAEQAREEGRITLTEKERAKIDETIKKAAEDAKSKGITGARSAMQQRTLPIMKDLINRMVKDSTNAKELSNAIEDIGNQFLKGIDKFRDGEYFIYRPGDTVNPEAAEAGLKEFQENMRDTILSQLIDLIPPSKFADLKPNNTGANALVKPEPQIEGANAVARGATPEAEEQFQRNQRDAAGRRAESDLDPSSYQGRNISFKDFLRLIALLVQIGGLGFFAWFIVYNATVHSGCQKISCDKDDTFPVATPVLCFGGGTGVPPFNGAIGYTSDACTCNSTSGSSECSPNNCKDETIRDNLRPWLNGCSPGTEDKCLNEDQLTCPFVKYRYQVFDPAGALLNTAAAAADGANKEGGDFLDGLIKLAKWIGIIIGVLLVLYIIYKVVSNRGSSETLKIVSAPPATGTSVSKFGRYLGDLSRYSNYGLMGRCGTYGLIPM